MDLCTIGHYKHPIDKFIQLLINHRMKLLVDARSTPYSRFNPQFNKNALQQALFRQHIEYVYAGEELGGRPKNPECYRQHAIPSKADDYLNEINYQEVMKRPWFLKGIQQLIAVASQNTTTIMCSEEDPEHRHRHHLIASYLLSAHAEVTILHIRGDGCILDAKSIPSLSDQVDTKQLSF